jgi:GT2 family glycosyltransferase
VKEERDSLTTPRVAAVIVTHDRVADLRRCVDAVRSQTLPVDATIVVDNASSDGTCEWLDSQPDVTAIHQGDEGPAGGIHTGIGHAYESGFDAMWVLDDDALPETTALERLVNAPANDGSNVVGSLIVSPHDKEVLAFPIPKLSTYSTLLDYYRHVTDRVADLRAESDERGYPWSMLMNSSLLPRRVVADVGLPKREFYMGGEETEYHYRVRSHGFGTYLVLDSICRHPKRDVRDMPKWRRRSLVRNTVYIHRHYRRWFLARTLRLAVVYVATGRQDFLRPIWDGLRGDFSRRYNSASPSQNLRLR